MKTKQIFAPPNFFDRGTKKVGQIHVLAKLEHYNVGQIVTKQANFVICFELLLL
jgi:hypothetical protein